MIGGLATQLLKPTLGALLFLTLGISLCLADGALPAAVDNSQRPEFPVIRSQGSLGSCAAFCATYYLLTHEIGQREGWNNKNNENTTKFSPKFTYNMVNGGSNSGSWMSDSYSIFASHGCATWADFPYDNNYRQWLYNKPEGWRTALNYRICGTTGVGALGTEAGLNTLKQRLAEGRIFNYATYIYDWQFTTVGNDPNTAADDAFAGNTACHWVKAGSDGGHGMTIVGYNDDIWIDINTNGAVDSGEKGALRIANSWGTGWKNGGFTWIAYDALRSTSAVPDPPALTRQTAFWSSYAYGITVCESSPPKLLAEFKINHAKRSQMRMSLGKAAAGAAAPTRTWSGAAINSDGGGYGFDGLDYSANPAGAPDGTFIFDFTPLLPEFGSVRSYFVGLDDTTDAAFAGTLKRFRLMDRNGRALEDSGDLNLQDADTYGNPAYAKLESDLSDLLVESASIGVDEGASAALKVKLAYAPAAQVIVTTSRIGGDSDISVIAGGTLTFSAANWNQYQEVRLAAADDSDMDVGSADLFLDGGDFSSLPVQAYEIENDAIYAAQMDDDPGWTLEGGWAWGAPAGQGGSAGSWANPDPTAGYTGDKVMGYNLAGDYPANMSATQWATSPAIDTTGCQNVALKFQRWLNVEGSPSDYAHLQISSDNGATWQALSGSPFYGSDNSWRAQSIDVSSLADNRAQVRLRFGMGPSNGSYQYSGWNIDDLLLVGDCEPLTINASAGAGGAISPAGSISVIRGSSRNFAISADAGWLINDVAVDGVSLGAIAEYTFENLAANHSISAAFKPDHTPPGAASGLRLQ